MGTMEPGGWKSQGTIPSGEAANRLSIVVSHAYSRCNVPITDIVIRTRHSSPYTTGYALIILKPDCLSWLESNP